MTIDWRATLADIDAALVSASVVDSNVGRRIRSRLDAAGRRYDKAFPPAPAADTPDTNVESSAHVAWRGAMTDDLEELEEIASAADGNPPSSIGPDVSAAAAATRARLQAAASNPEISAALRALAQDALYFRLPGEPKFFVDEYYRHTSTIRDQNNGELEAAVQASIDEAVEWIAIV